MIFILGIILTSLLGGLLFLILTPKMDFFEKLALCFPFGLGILTFLMFLGSLAGIGLNLGNILLTLFCLVFVLMIVSKDKLKPFIKGLRIDSFRKFSLGERIIFILLVSLVLYVVISNFYWPVTDWDALTLYDFRAKLIAQTGSISGFGEEIGFNRLYYAYPLMTSLAHVWVRLLGFLNPRFIYTLFYLGLLVGLYFSVKKASTRLIGLLFTLILGTNDMIFGHALMTYTNLPFVFYFYIGTIFQLEFMEKGKIGYLVVGALSLGLSAWTRGLEPFYLVNIFLLFLWTIKQRNFLPLIIFLVIFLPFQRVWPIYVNQVVEGPLPIKSPFTQSFQILTSGIDFQRILKVTRFIWESVFVSWGPIFIIFCFIALYNLSKNKKLDWFLLLIGLNIALIIGGTYIFSFMFLKWEIIPGSVSRMAMFLIPFFLYYIAKSGLVKRVIK